MKEFVFYRDGRRVHVASPSHFRIEPRAKMAEVLCDDRSVHFLNLQSALRWIARYAKDGSECTIYWQGRMMLATAVVPRKVV